MKIKWLGSIWNLTLDWNGLNWKANSSVIRQKGESQNGGNKKTKHAIFSVKTNISYPDTQVCILGGKKCSFFGKFHLFCFLATSVLRYALLLYYRRPVTENNTRNNMKHEIIWNLRVITALNPIHLHISFNSSVPKLYNFWNNYSIKSR